MIDLVSVVSIVGSSGALIVGRDIWLARKTVKNSEAAEQRNQAREPLVVESILLNNATKVAELLQTSIAELEDAKRRAVEELRETRTQSDAQLAQLTQELERLRKENERKDQTIRELYTKLGELHDKLEKIQQQKEI